MIHKCIIHFSWLFLSLILAPSPALSGPIRTVHVEFSYFGPPVDFNLYRDGVLVCVGHDPDARQMDCPVEISTTTPMVFVLTAVAEGIEAPAEPYVLVPPVAKMTATQVAGTWQVAFDASESSDADGVITAYHWNFGDGKTGSGRSIVHRFMASGDYRVRLTVTDNHGAISPQDQMFVSVLDVPPRAVNRNLSVGEDGTVSGTLTATDVDKDPFTFSLTQPAHGTATLVNARTGAFTYRPDRNYNGTDSFTYRARETLGERLYSSPATVAITITRVNDAPRAVNKRLSVAEDGTLSGTLTAVDVDKDPLTFSLVTRPAHGTAKLLNVRTGAFTYKPAANYNGTDSFTYRARDGKVSSTPATAAITITRVNDAPRARADVAEVARGKSVTIPVRANDTDLDLDPLRVVSVTTPKHGKAAIVTGAIRYTANATYRGVVVLTYTISDGKSGTATGTVTVTVK